MTLTSPVMNFSDFEVDERADDETVDGARPDGGSDGRSVTDYDARVMHTMTEPEPMEDRVTKPGLTRILGSPTITELTMRVPQTMTVLQVVLRQLV